MPSQTLLPVSKLSPGGALSLALASLGQQLSPSVPATYTPSLRDYVAEAWHVIEPATPYVPNWHIDAICEHLEAVTRGDIRDLLINVPPRHSKSILVAVMWPTWEWITAPHMRWLYASYAASLSIRDSLKCRRLIESPWYQRHWGGVYQLTGDQNVKSRYDTTATGYRIATSVGGTATGEGGQRLICDDPLSANDAHSDAVREAANTWWSETMSTRGNDVKTATRVIVMQRLHERDVSGFVLERGGYEHLCLPAEYDEVRRSTILGNYDPRTVKGELLDPARFPREELEKLKADLRGAASGQLQQRPQPLVGNLFKREWWRRYRTLPALTRVEIVMDSAFKTGVANDPTVMDVWGTDGLGNYYLIDEWRDKVEYPELLRSAHDLHAKHRALALTVPVVIEDKASGQSAIQTLSRPLPTQSGTTLPALPVLPFPDKADPREVAIARLEKFARAEGVTGLVQSGHVFIPEDTPWVNDWVTEHADFPSALHDDRVDCTSMALTRFTQPGKPRMRLL